MVNMTALYDWIVQGLVASPLAVQIVVVLGCALPACAAAALVMQRAIDALSGRMDAWHLVRTQKNKATSKEPNLDA